VTYLSDGVHLFEVVAEQADQNYGLAGGWLRRTILRDVVSEREGVVDDLHLAALSEVRA
jgi:hypothetical protein